MENSDARGRLKRNELNRMHTEGELYYKEIWGFETHAMVSIAQGKRYRSLEQATVEAKNHMQSEDDGMAAVIKYDIKDLPFFNHIEFILDRVEEIYGNNCDVLTAMPFDRVKWIDIKAFKDQINSALADLYESNGINVAGLKEKTRYTVYADGREWVEQPSTKGIGIEAYDEGTGLKKFPSSREVVGIVDHNTEQESNSVIKDIKEVSSHINRVLDSAECTDFTKEDLVSSLRNVLQEVYRVTSKINSIKIRKAAETKVLEKNPLYTKEYHVSLKKDKSKLTEEELRAEMMKSVKQQLEKLEFVKYYLMPPDCDLSMVLPNLMAVSEEAYAAVEAITKGLSDK